MHRQNHPYFRGLRNRNYHNLQISICLFKNMPLSDTWEGVILIVDIVMFAIAIISIIAMSLCFYRAGFFFGNGSVIYAQNQLMYAGACIATLSVSMTWIFVRFFRNWGKIKL